MNAATENNMVIESERAQEQSDLRASLWLVGALTLAMTVVLIPLAS